MGTLLIISGLFNQLNAHCAKCSKIEVERMEEQSKADYQKNEYYDDYQGKTKTDEATLNNLDKPKSTETTSTDNKVSYSSQSSLTWLAALENNALSNSFQTEAQHIETSQTTIEQKQANANQAVFESTIADILSMENFTDVFKNPYTILVPSNEAIRKFSAVAFNKALEPQNKELLFSYIANHIIPHQILKKDFNKTFKTLGGRIVEINSTENGLVINRDAKILKSYPLGHNGIMYVMDRVLIPIHD